MASRATEAEKVAAESYVEVRAPAAKDNFALVDVVLRLVVFASGLVAVLVMVTSKETQVVAQIPVPPFLVRRAAKFNTSPAFIFFVASFSVAGLYGLITSIISFFALVKPGSHTKLISQLIIFDVLLLGMMGAATGAATAVAYIGLEGNKHVQWNKICHVYGEFCKHVGASVAVGLVGSAVLALLILFSVRSMSNKIPKHNPSY